MAFLPSIVRERNENFNRSCSWNYVNCKPFDSCRIFRPAAFHVTWCWLTPTTANQFSYKREFPAFLTRHRRHFQLFQWSIRRPRFPVRPCDKNYKKRQASARKLTRSATYSHKVENFFNLSNDCIYLYRILCVFNNRFHMKHNNGNKNRPNIIFSILKYFNVSISVHWKALRCSQAIQLSIALLFFRNVFTWLCRRFKWFYFMNKKHNTFKYDFTYNEYI